MKTSVEVLILVTRQLISSIIMLHDVIIVFVSVFKSALHFVVVNVNAKNMITKTLNLSQYNVTVLISTF